MANRSRTFVASASPSLPLVAGATAVPALRASAAATFEQRALELVNGAGAARGIGPVQVSTALAGIAGDAPYDGCGDRVLGRSTDMGARNYFSHTIRDCANKGVSAISRPPASRTARCGEHRLGQCPHRSAGGRRAAQQRPHGQSGAPGQHPQPGVHPRRPGIGRTPDGATWSGGGSPLPNVFLTTQLFAARLSTGSPVGGRYHSVTRSRILDTRAGRGPLGPAATMDVQVAGQGGVPSAGVAAVVLNVAVTNPTSSSYLTVFPAASAMPTASRLNFVAAQTVPNLVSATLGAGRAAVAVQRRRVDAPHRRRGRVVRRPLSRRSTQRPGWTAAHASAR